MGNLNVVSVGPTAQMMGYTSEMRMALLIAYQMIQQCKQQANEVAGKAAITTYTSSIDQYNAQASGLESAGWTGMAGSATSIVPSGFGIGGGAKIESEITGLNTKLENAANFRVAIAQAKLPYAEPPAIATGGTGVSGASGAGAEEIEKFLTSFKTGKTDPAAAFDQSIEFSEANDPNSNIQKALRLRLKSGANLDAEYDKPSSSLEEGLKRKYERTQGSKQAWLNNCNQLSQVLNSAGTSIGNVAQANYKYVEAETGPEAEINKYFLQVEQGVGQAADSQANANAQQLLQTLQLCEQSVRQATAGPV